MKVPPDAVELTDGRVRLRPLRPDDIPAVVAACQDPETQRWTTIPVPYAESDARWFVEEYASRSTHGTVVVFAITLEDDRFAGAIDLTIDEHDMGTVGFSVAPWARRRGVGTAALRLICRWALEELHLRRVEWWAMVGNWPSRRMAERVGFALEGTCRQRIVARGERYDGWVAGLLPGELT